MANKLYTQCIVEADGALIYENQTVGVSHPQTGEIVNTIPGGAQGRAPGPKQTSLSITNAVPKGTRKVNWARLWKTETSIRIRCVQLGGQELEGEFLVDSVETQSGVGAATTDSVSLISIGPDAPIFE